MPCSIHQMLREESRQSDRGERCAQITPDDLWQPRLAQQRAETAQRAGELLVGLGPRRQQVVGIPIAHRQRIAALAVAEGEPALEIDRPDFVGLGGLRQLFVEGRIHSGPPPATHAQPVAA